MPYATQASPKGSSVQYGIDPDIKKYALRDMGFIETKQGNFQWIRPLDPTPQIETGYKFKLTISKDLKGLKMSIVTRDGLSSVDIFHSKREDADMIQEKFQFYMNHLLHRHILTVVES